MAVCDIKPFVRYAARSNRFTNSFFTRSYDCRLLYVLSGSGTFCLKNESFPLKKGTLVFYPAGVTYRPCSSPEDPMTFISVNFDYNLEFSSQKRTLKPVSEEKFDEKLIFDSASRLGIPALQKTLVLYSMQTVEGALLELVDEFTKKTAYFEETASALLETVIYKALRYSTANRKTPALGDKILDYIRQNFAKQLDYQTIGAHFSYHPYYINSLIKKHTGMSLHKYLTLCRMQEAVRLLTSTELPISEVAEQVGIHNEKYFSVCFKAHTGETPSKYRNTRNI